LVIAGFLKKNTYGESEKKSPAGKLAESFEKGIEHPNRRKKKKGVLKNRGHKGKKNKGR